MGFADVGADVFLAIGLVAAYAAGFSPFAFLLASICYITTGLVYAELTSLYPYAGGGQIFGVRAGGDKLGFIIGWAILLDYVLNIGLFSIAAAGYLSFIFSPLRGIIPLHVGSFAVNINMIGLTAFIIVITLIILNIIGIKESSFFNQILVIITLLTEAVVLSLAYLLVFNPESFVFQLGIRGVDIRLPNVFYTGLLDTQSENFIYGVTLAMSSFIGIESIAQAAEETRNPWKYLPRAFKYSIIAVVALTLLFSVLGLGVLGWEGLAINVYNPIASIAAAIPIIGNYLAVVVAFVAFSISMVSTNTGVIGVSRVVYSMSRFRLIPRFLSKLHKKRATPYISIIIFGLIGGLLAFTGEIFLVASLYNFGALLSYMLVNYSHIKLRNLDSEAYRPWKTPLNINVGNYEVSLLSIIGLISTSILFTLIIIYHPDGRILGLSWIIIGILIFAIYRFHMGKSIKEDLALKMLTPAMPHIKTMVYFPLFANYPFIKRLIKAKLGDIHDLYLVTVIPRRLFRKVENGDVEIASLSRSVSLSLNRICEDLSEYKCQYAVVIDDTVEDGLLRYMEENNIDQVCIPIVKRRRKKKTIETSKLKRRAQVIFLSE
jgi:APA family basic amino acid/polyamine antiporter